ncbi:MAG: 2OG-Fe(II) oxygenase [Betaproteobacteria bacterium]
MSASPQIWDHFLSDELGSNLLRWFEADSDWTKTEGKVFVYDRLTLGNREVPDDCRAILSSKFVLAIKTLAEKCAAKPLSTKYRLMAHRLVQGQGIGLHTDEARPGVVFNVFINREWREEFGGYLILFRSANNSDISAVIAPLHNRAVAIPVHKTSFHAVSDVFSGTRFALSYFFSAL